MILIWKENHWQIIANKQISIITPKYLPTIAMFFFCC